ncbi:MAG: trigger factor, partial [Methylobacter sp.]|nr:trigger factor [Methylobacter sp.]
ELSRKMTVSVPEDVIQEKMAARLKSLAREVKIDGFRPGKVPQHVVKKMYGERVRGEIAGDLIQSTYYEALKDHDLKPVSYPHILPLDEAEGFKYTAEFEVYPEISLEGLGQIQVARPTASVQDVDIEDMVEKLRVQKKSWAVVERAAQEHDRITIGFSGVCEGENFTNGKVDSYPVEIGAKQMIPGFEESLLGLKAGDNKTFELSFPEVYGNEKLAGKVAEFNVDVISVEEGALPAIDDEFIKAYGVEGSVDAFREDIRANLAGELEQALRGKLKNAVLKALYEKIQITVPNALVDLEVENMMKPYIETAKRQKVKLDDLKLPRDEFEEQARRRIALGLILGEIIDKNNIRLDDDKVRSTIEDMARSYERPQEVIDWYYSDKSRLNDVRQMVLENQAVDWIVAQAKVTDEAISFTDAMSKQA